MANPVSYPAKSGDLTTTTLHLVLPIGAAGAVGTATRSHEFVAAAPATHDATGVYSALLRESWVALLGYHLNCKQATYSASGACEVTLKTDSVSASTPKVVVEVRTAAGVLVDPASGDILFLTLDLQQTKP